MSTKQYYARWLEIKNEFQKNLEEDTRIQEFAINFVGLKPQATAVEVVARVYCKYCELYNKICECYDQMGQAQRRPYMRNLIDTLTCRIIELKKILEEVEVFEYTYPDNALQQMLIIPQDVEIMCPFFYPFEMRRAEMQHIIDQIFAGNRIGDLPLTPSQLQLQEEARREEELRLEEEKAAQLKYQQTMGYDIVSEHELQLTPSEIEANRLREEYETNVFNIQRMERSRYVTKEKFRKKNKDENLYLELSGLKKPPAPEALRKKAAEMLQLIFRQYMLVKREHMVENQRKEKLGMIIPSYKKPSAKEQLEKVQEVRRNFRRAYYEKWLAQTVKEKSRVLRLREGDIMEDISDEIRQWLSEWFARTHVFDEFPFPEEGGSILIVKGETLTIPEYLEWKEAEEKRIKAEGGKQKSKEEIKAEKSLARQEKKRLAQEAKEKEAKRLLDYKKMRLNPANDPGIYLKISNSLNPLQFSWADYEGQWKAIDEPEAGLDAQRGYLMNLITENAYKDTLIQLRPVVDEFMRLELEVLKNAMKLDYQNIGMNIPMTQKRKKPKKIKNPRPEKVSPARMFQILADEGIIRKYPQIKLDSFWGDRNYAAASSRAILWTPTFPSHCIGDIKELIRTRCVLTLGASCPDIPRAQLIVGPKGTGKKTLVYAVATETNALLIDLSPLSVYNKFQGTKATKMMWTYVQKISRLMQPTIIFVDNADKLFYKKVPKEEKMFDPTRLSKDFFKEIIKPIGKNDKVLVLGTATEPWLATKPKMYKVFPNTIMIPKSDYASISFILKKMLMEYHAVDREFNVHSLAQLLRGYNISIIKEVVEKLLTGSRLCELSVKPLQPMEILNGVLANENAVCIDATDLEMYNEWYLTYSPWGPKYFDYMYMLEIQYAFKLKEDKKK